MKTALFNYELPASFIAQNPVEPRDSSRLMVLDRKSGAIEHRRFREIVEYLDPGDILIANDSRVIHARLFGFKSTGGKVEILLLRQLVVDKPGKDDMPTGDRWECLVRGRNIRAGSLLTLDTTDAGVRVQGTVESVDAASGTRTIRFTQPLTERLSQVGHVPLPPYITAFTGDPEQYQTVFGDRDGSVAAPTAGLHFTPDLLIDLHRRGIAFDTVTLHVGLDTFRQVECENIEEHQIHTEIATLNSAVARRINEGVLQGRRTIAVGTTSVRTLEWAATSAQGIDPYDDRLCPWQRTAAFSGPVDLFIRPGYRFRVVDTLITNFHLPQSSLLMLVSAFVGEGRADIDEGRRCLLAAYEEAKKMNYRFFSFGDAMLIV